MIASCGHPHVLVRRKPRVAILATGDELVSLGGSPGPDQVFGSNNAAIAAAVTAWGGEPMDLGIAADRIDAITGAINAAAGADLLVTTGGASVGEHDLVRKALATRGFTSGFWKVAMRPGKPVIFGKLDEMPVLGMSGNPVSALVSALMFLRPAIKAMLVCLQSRPSSSRRCSARLWRRIRSEKAMFELISIAIPTIDLWPFRLRLRTARC